MSQATEITNDQFKLINAVKAQALKWYDKGWCWDYVLECLSNADILAHIGNARTEKGAINNVFKSYVKPLQIGQSNAAWG